MEQQQKMWDETAIVSLLMASKAACARAVLALYARQTEDERSEGATRHSNGRGFSAYDAEFMTSIAKALPRYNMNLTDKQLARCRKILPRYRRQLLEIAQEKGAPVKTKGKAPDVITSTQQHPEPAWGQF